MKKEYLIDEQVIESEKNFSVEDVETAPSSAGAFFFFFYYHNS